MTELVLMVGKTFRKCPRVPVYTVDASGNAPRHQESSGGFSNRDAFRKLAFAGTTCVPHGRCMTTLSPRACPECGTSFQPKQSVQRHCSYACGRSGMRVHRVPLEQRFWKYLTAGPVDECWEWQGARDHHGYGRIQRGGARGGLVKAHRASWEIHNGPIPDGLLICHQCDNPPCCNPAHLFLGTYVDNGQDMSRKGRAGQLHGDDNVRTIYPDAFIRGLREEAARGRSVTELAEAYGIGVRYVSALVLGRRRRSAGGPIREPAR